MTDALAMPLIFMLIGFNPMVSMTLQDEASNHLTAYDQWIYKLQKQYGLTQDRVLLLTPKKIETHIATLYWPFKNEMIPPVSENLYGLVIVDNGKNYPTWFLTYCFKLLRYGGRIVVAHDYEILLSIEKE